MMKSVRKLSLAIAISGLIAAPAFAQNAGFAPAFQTSRFSQPALLPEFVPVPAVEKTAYTQPSGGYMLTARRADDGPAPAPAAGEAPSVIAPDSNSAPVVQHVPSHSADGSYTTGGCTNDAVSGGCTGSCDVCLPTCCPTWSAYLGGVYLGRDTANKKWTTYETGNNANQLMYFPDSDWGGGPEVRIMRAIGCGDACGGCPNTFLEGVYYGVYDMDAYDSRVSATNQLSSTLDVGFVDYVAPGSPASAFFDNSAEHRVWRDDEFHNVEINIVRYIMGAPNYGAAQPFSLALIGGFRFIKFDDNLLFGAVSSGNTFGGNGGLNEAYFTSDVENNLYGFQLGAMISHGITSNLSWYATPKFGFFGNQIDFSARGYRGDGATANFSQTGNAFDLSNSKNDVAVMGQLDLGLNYVCNQHWSITGGYRVIGLTGIALADDQVPAYLAAENDWTDIDSSGSLLLHGAFAGVTYAW